MPLRRARGSRQGQDQGRGLNSQASCVPRIRRAGRQHTLELAMLISLTSLGSNQTLRLPHLSTLAASRFCSKSDTPILATSHEPGVTCGQFGADYQTLPSPSKASSGIHELRACPHVP